MINLRIGGIIVVAFIAGAFVASPELRAYAANTVFSTDIVDGQVKTPDIATSAVTNSKIASSAITNSKIGSSAVSNSKLASNSVTASKILDGAVGTADIADGTITYTDLSRSFVRIEHRDDCNCGGTGWDTDGTFSSRRVFDDAVTPTSVISISLTSSQIECTANQPNIGSFVVDCDKNIPGGASLNYAIFNKG